MDKERDGSKENIYWCLTGGMGGLVEDGWLSRGMGGYIGIAVGCFVRC